MSIKIKFSYSDYGTCKYATFFSYLANSFFAIIGIIPGIMIISLPLGIFEAISTGELSSLFIGIGLCLVGVALIMLYVKIINPLINKIAVKIAQEEKKRNIGK